MIPKYNKEKLKNAVLYIAKNGGNDVGKKKLAKILYFIDFTLYELRKKSLTEIAYTKQDFGPMPEPKLFYNALSILQKEGDIEMGKPNHFNLEKINAKKEADMNVFSPEEIEQIKDITEKYRLCNAGELEKIAQSEPPYKMVEYQEEIPYHLAFYRNSFGEMDLKDENSNT